MTAETAMEDLELILPTPKMVTVDGIDCTVRHLKTRELFAFLGVFTSTLGGQIAPVLADLTDKKGEELQGELVGLMLICAPAAVDPLLTLAKKIVDPVDETRASEVRLYLDNPELEDLLAITDAVIENEKDNLEQLLGKVKMYMAKWTETFTKKKGTAKTGTRGRKRST